ncbi:hypothetical protein CU103_09140 [Phyllobacterium sophorae]|uniref:Uncharacterized protein n=1 Tax=Phyllobacterium sophorae TaxID=1520277 RepID=A0A2P7BFA9_9HYPH|nr:hypothetical protein CU103_09140 [Phyllobacterium sophorae]
MNAALDAVIGNLSASGKRRLLESMDEIRSVLGTVGYSGDGKTIVREPRNGELGWVIHRHSIIHAREYLPFRIKKAQ